MSTSESTRHTLTALDKYHGSKLFEQAAFTIGLDDLISRRLLFEALSMAATDPWKMSIDDLGAVLPEVERRLRLLVPADDASAACARIRNFVLSWEE